jgi:hypothetical protein
MKHSWPVVLAAALLLISVNLDADLSEQTPRRLTDAQWQDDVNTVVTLLEAHHPNLYQQISRAQFQQARQALASAIPQLDDRSIAVRMMQLVASLRDGHTVLLPNDPAGFNSWLPLSFYRFSDGLYIVAADTRHAELIGARVEQIAGTSGLTVFERTADLLSSDNASGRLWNTFYLSSVDALVATCVSAQRDSVSLSATLRNLESRTVSLEPIVLPFSLEHRFWGEMYPPGAREHEQRYRMPIGELTLAQWRQLPEAERAGLPLHLRSRLAYWYTVLPERMAAVSMVARIPRERHALRRPRCGQ